MPADASRVLGRYVRHANDKAGDSPMASRNRAASEHGHLRRVRAGAGADAGDSPATRAIRGARVPAIHE
jgi:hypothetical protein